MDNEELIQKTIEVADMQFGGRLNPTQQDEFVRLVKDFSVMLKTVRFKQMANSRTTIDKIYIGEPVSRGVTENDSTAVNATAKFDQVQLLAEKLKSDWQITTEALQDNIEGSAFEDVIMSMFSKRISTDMELLAIQGDTTVGAGTPLLNLLSTLDGWDVLTNNAHIVDNAAAGVSRGLFASMIRRMPEQYLQDPDLRWMASRAVATDWAEFVSERATVAGDDALGGNSLRPFGIPMQIVPQIPSRRALTIVAASPAVVLSGEFGPYEIVAGSNDGFSLRVNGEGAGAVTFTVSAGTYTVSEFAAAYQAAYIAAGGTITDLIVRDDGTGRLLIQTAQTGVAAVIIIGAATGNAEVGLTAATTTGAATGGTVNEGTFLWLANPKNFIFGMVDDTRVYTEFNKNVDAIETVIYNQVAVEVENTEAIVKAVNVRAGAPVI